MNEKMVRTLEFGLALVIALMGAVVFSFSTFATKEEIRESIVNRLDRIEIKLDKVLERK